MKRLRAVADVVHAFGKERIAIGRHDPPPAVDLLCVEESGLCPGQLPPAAERVVAGRLGVGAAGQRRQREGNP